MPVNILMPALSPTMEKGNLTKWLKKEGDKVKPGDVIAEIETDKATMEYEAIDEGTLAKIVVPEGTQDVPVKALIAVLAEEGEDVKAAAAGAGKGAPAPKPAPPPAKPASAATPPPPMGEGVSARPSATMRSAPKVAEAAAARAAPPAPVSPRGEGADEGIRTAHPNRVFSSPLARRLAKEAGIDLARVGGSGPHGRVIARDVEAAKSGRGIAAPAMAAAGTVAPTVQTPTDEKIRALFEPGSYDVR